MDACARRPAVAADVPAPSGNKRQTESSFVFNAASDGAVGFLRECTRMSDDFAAGLIVGADCAARDALKQT